MAVTDGMRPRLTCPLEYYQPERSTMLFFPFDANSKLRRTMLHCVLAVIQDRVAQIQLVNDYGKQLYTAHSSCFVSHDHHRREP